jgi:hypothetical protein
VRAEGNGAEEVATAIADVPLVYPRAMFDYIGVVLIAVVLISQKVRKNESSTA